MLVELSVHDFVIIERATLEPAPGLTVVTGATGDGKTLLLRALRFLLGERVAPERVVRAGSERALVEGLFRIEDPGLRRELRELGAPDDWDEPELVLARSVELTGRGRARIGGRLASVGELRRVGERLVDILSQHEYQSLVRPERQRRVLDGFGHLDETRACFQAARAALRALAVERDRLVSERELVLAREARLRDELEALRALAPADGEFDELERERGLLANVDAVRRALEAGYDRLTEREGSALDLVRATLRDLEPQAGRTAALGRVVETLSSVAAELADAATELSSEKERLDVDPGRLAAVDERLDAFRDLARRLAGSELPRPTAGPLHDPRGLPERWKALEAELGSSASPDERAAELEREIGSGARSLEALGAELSKARAAAAATLEAAVQATLADLALTDARFAVSVERLAGAPVAPERNGSATAALDARFPAPDGVDRVAFLFASGPGLPLRPVGEVASGGELARLCLALKKGLAEADDVPLLVFDEVDQNVGGRLGAALGRTLGAIAGSRQVLAVTHLPSVAAHGVRHLLVEKEITAAGPERRARTSVRALAPDDRVRELAIMIRGEPVTATSLEQARELLAAASVAEPRVPEPCVAEPCVPEEASEAPAPSALPGSRASRTPRGRVRRRGRSRAV